jgi:uncharacterized membrane protein
MRWTTKNQPSSALIILAALCLLTGLLLRVVDIKAHVFWHDEVHTILRAFGSSTPELTRVIFDGKIHTVQEIQAFQKPNPQKTLKDTLHSLAGHPEHGPLYYFMVRLVAPFFDPPLAGARLLAALISLFLFPAMYFLAKELFPDHPSAPIIALCVTALSPINILYAREARQYALYEVLMVLSTWQYLRACRSQRGWGLYAIIQISGLYTHLMFAVLMLTHGCHLLLNSQCRNQWKSFFKAVVVAVFCFSPWIYVVLDGMSQVKSYTNWMKHPVPLSSLFRSWSDHLHHVVLDLPGIVLLKWISIPFVIACFYHTLMKSPRKSSWLLALTLGFNFIPLMIPDLLSGGQRSAGARYVLPALIVLQLCVVFFIADIMKRKNFSMWLGNGVILTLLAGTCLFGYVYLNTDTWWNRYCSLHNPVAARLINAGERPLVIADTTPTNPGDVMSLSYLVKPETPFLTLQVGAALDPPKGYSIFLFNPSWELQQLQQVYPLSPVPETASRLWMDPGKKPNR